MWWGNNVADSIHHPKLVNKLVVISTVFKRAGWNGEHLIPSQLAILPGATHYNSIFRTDLLLPVLTHFLGEASKH